MGHKARVLCLGLVACAGAAEPRSRAAPTRTAVQVVPAPTSPPVSRAPAPAHADLRVAGAPHHELEGFATYYGPGFHGRRTASGERFNMHAMTAAHRTLPFGTRVRVTSERTGQVVIVRINDRGPYGRLERIIDLSLGAARRLGLDRAGVMRVRLEVLGP